MLIRKPADLRYSDVTPKEVYLNRRRFLTVGAATLGGLALPSAALATAKVNGLVQSGPYHDLGNEKASPKAVVTGYNNFYEFGTQKEDPAQNAPKWKLPAEWTIRIEGEVMQPKTLSLDQVMKLAPPEERIYRHRCVERWSIVVPWIGFSLGDLLKRFEPAGNAAFVEFVTVLRPEEMPGQKGRFTSVLPWPYNEGLRLDEAMHPLAMIAVGLYGEELPNQNGAPLRLVVPWKYGFKSIKSIAKIRFVEKQPFTTWMKEEPLYYGFYSNVNPAQTRSSFRDQSNERRLGEFLMRKTLPFNGYADQVASLYAGMDLKKNY
jgi:sulfoxide reductase catalytic subunit YedY